jgi:hypothetical protein
MKLLAAEGPHFSRLPTDPGRIDEDEGCRFLDDGKQLDPQRAAIDDRNLGRQPAPLERPDGVDADPFVLHQDVADSEDDNRAL